jgi:hypothetical protein
MKKSLLTGLLGLSLSVASSFGQGTIFLDNYFTSGPTITFSPSGVALPAGWTMGFYYALGDVRGSVASDPFGIESPSTLGGGLTLAIGPGSTADFFTSSFGTPGRGFASSFFGVPGTAAAGGNTITLMVVAYDGSTFDSSPHRGHSAGFIMTTSANNSSSPNSVGSFMPAFSVFIPEPSSFALMVMSGFAWLIVRRQKTCVKPSAALSITPQI